MQPVKHQKIVLASEAKWRSDILLQLGIPHVCAKHAYHEPQFVSGEIIEFVAQISLQKALSILPDYNEYIIISADQLVCADQHVFGKPGTHEHCISQLKCMRGKTHELVTAVSVVFEGQHLTETDIARLTMRELTDEELENYVSHDKPYGCAGSYKIESLGASLFESVQVSDLNTIIGIPGNRLINMLRQLGFSNLL